MPDTYQEGQTATSKDGQRRVVFRNGLWLNDTTFKPPGVERAPTSAQDRTELNAASAKAAAERDALRTYKDAEKAVRTMGPKGTGPLTAWYLDAITPDDDAPSKSGGGFWNAVGDTIGAVPDVVGSLAGLALRPLVSQDTWNARDQLKTVNANVALAGSQKMKGASSDKDTALMRLSGLGPYKQKAENLRIIKEAEYVSGLEQTRALVKSQWIAKYGSLANAAPNGMTFEQGLQLGERRYDEYFKGTRVPPKRGLPKPPPKKAAPAARIRTVDINGNWLDD